MCCLNIKSIVPVAEQSDILAALDLLFGNTACCNQKSDLIASSTLLLMQSSCMASACIAADVLSLQLTAGRA